MQVAPPAAPEPGGMQPPGWWIRFEEKAAFWFQSRGLVGRRAALIALGAAGGSTIIFALGTPRIAAILGVLATAFLWIASLEGLATSGTRRHNPFVQVMANLVDALMLTGVAMDAARTGTPVAAMLAGLGLGALLLLPRTGRELERELGRSAPGVWNSAERRLVFLLGAALDRTVLGLLVLVAVCAVDLGVRLWQLYCASVPSATVSPLPEGIAGLYREDGRAHGGVRIAVALAVILLMLVLPR